MQLPWKGNVRELRNLMERVAILVPSDSVALAGPDGRAAHGERAGRGLGRGAAARGAVAVRAAVHRDRLHANRGNLGDTARELGIERTNLYRKMKQLGIQAPARVRE